jgi:predicted dehydrogenase
MTFGRPLGLGVIGAGAFAEFVADAGAELREELAIVAVTDIDDARARRLADRHDAAVADDVSALLADNRVDAVVIATPPNTHASLTLAALGAGRHVFCEKPTALTGAEADQVRAAVAISDRSYVVDHVLRYNPIVHALTRLRGDGLLGRVQRLSFENDAADEDLPPAHWFWDDAVSGGIFLEHGVHFFDAAAVLLDDRPRAVQAIGGTRPDGITDTVVCTVAHADGALATYAHGFTHAHRAERQLMRLDCGLGEVRIHGWIPLRAELDVWTDRADDFAELPHRAAELFSMPGFRPSGWERIDVDIARDAAPAATRARGVAHHAPHHVRARLELGSPDAKQRVYTESVRAALHDLAVCARTGAAPLAGVDAGSAAVQLAQAATVALHRGQNHPLTALEAS